MDFERMWHVGGKLLPVSASSKCLPGNLGLNFLCLVATGQVPGGA